MRSRKLLYILVPTIFLLVSVGAYLTILRPKQFASTAPVPPTVIPTAYLENEKEKLPEIFPGDFPIYPHTQLTSSWSAANNLTEGFSVVWETSDSADIVRQYYVEQLALSQWETQQLSSEESSLGMSFKKGKISGFIGIITGAGNKTIISVTMGIEKE